MAIVRDTPSSQTSANLGNQQSTVVPQAGTQAQAIDPSAYPGLTGGGSQPYQLSSKITNAGTWANFWSLGSAQDAVTYYKDFVTNFNDQSKRIAAKYGVNSQQYSFWLQNSLPAATAAKSTKTGVAKNPTNPFTVLLDPHVWVRVAEFAGGGICLIGGVIYLFKSFNVSIPTPLAKVATKFPGT